ncbi:hypothetical protein ACHQM5_013208 [Ranunculus cassubicifolius]
MEDGGGEVRRLNIIYFLSRLGKMEHAHLFRVQHCNRSGIRLRDVKRWLAELRGKNMPDSFTWSYKRRYKSGFLWQDLLDDDLITPTADNEYVLKGSEIIIPFESCTCGKRTQKEPKPEEAPTKVDTKTPNLNIDLRSISEISVSSTKTSPTEEEVISEPSDSETSASTEVSFKSTAIFSPNALDSLNSLKSKASKTTEIEELGEEVNDKSLMKEDEQASEKAKEQAKTFSTRKSKPNKFSNLLNCGRVETNDAAMMMVNKSGTSGCAYSPIHRSSALICRLDTLGGSERKFNGPSWNQQRAHYARKNDSAGRSQRKSKAQQLSEAYKPSREPRCSQCGEHFRPEKLHAHMKSCKVFGRNRAAETEAFMRSRVPYTI